MEPDRIDALADPLDVPGEHTPISDPAMTEELLIEEISIDGMCGVY